MASKYDKFPVGATVEIKEGEVEAYGAQYREIDLFKPGMTGIVGSIKVAKVYGPRRGHTPKGWCPYFLCVDYLDSKGQKQRCAPEYSNVRLVKNVTETT